MSEKKVSFKRGELKELADRIPGTDKSHILRVVRGERRPSLELAQKLAELGHPVWSLYPDLKREEDGDAA